MANEKRLIDYDKMYLSVMDAALSSCDDDTIFDIMDASVVDAVPVVRCRDCKWYQIRRWNDTKPEYDCRKTHALLDVSPEDFCSYGERKDGDGNG